jgi:hypothetical protein
MSNKLFLASIAGAALAATSLANVPSSQALPQGTIEVGGSVSFANPLGGNYTTGVGVSATTPGSGGTATSGVASTASPTAVGTAVDGTATTAGGLSSTGAATTSVTLSPSGAVANAGANAQNSGGNGVNGTAIAGTNTATYSLPGLGVGGGQAGSSYGAINSTGF